MFDPTSRYYPLKTATLAVTDSNGLPREVRYVKRRFIPSEVTPTLVEHQMLQSDRLDHITARYLGDPTQFWRVCDANRVLRPEDLEVVGRVVRIAFPQLQ